MENGGNLKGTGNVKMQRTTGSSMYAFQDVPGRGQGLVAIKNIPKGTRILSEEPIITIPRNKMNSEVQLSISQQVATLSEHERQTFLSMHNIHPYKDEAERYFGIVRTNSLPAEIEGDEGAILLEASRVNHACDNNAQKNWNGVIKRHTVHALKDIEIGEEITIYYLGIRKNRTARRQALQTGFGFECLCGLCCVPLEQSQESDRRLDEIDRLDGVINQLGPEGILSSPLRTLRYYEQQVRLYKEQGRDDIGLAQAFIYAAWVTIANGDLARGRILAERAVSIWETAFGGDSKEAIEHGIIAQDPSMYELYGLSDRWKTTVDEAPSGLEPNDFEDWLWKREKPKHRGPLADLRSRATFPEFNGLPGENYIDSDFYESSGMLAYRPRRHWCFLGEIVDISSLLRLEMKIEDVDGTRIPLLFYTDGRGNELAPTQVQKGYTVAILYAKRHVFMFCEPGIRHEDPELMKIFPLSLSKLLALNDKVQQFSMETDGIRTCHGCGKKGASLQRCSKCLSFGYCGKACQVAGWNEKGHKADCKFLKDPSLRGLFAVKWDKFDNHIQFPL
ncbi:hypothetical protein GX50_00586 [[Emmonsia] crescens]|uniref:Uncharacterized protein n=1 Tax=[Emmonsia] crescens TaxID=73230 RepID=A0A2B7ZTN8_9EURO|nr:hypothetical protein GX50_00586 [Emmonsia crescens]